MKVCTIEGCEKRRSARGWCTTHYAMWQRNGDPTKRKRHWSTGQCQVEGCEGKPKGLHCSTHAARLRRTGTTYLAPKTGRHTNEHGYEVIKRPGHPVAQANGWAYEHRVVLFDAVGEGPQPCYWCGKSLRWQADYRRDADYLVVDHLDNNPGNNSIENLAPSCQPCNTTHSYVITRHRVRKTRSVSFANTERRVV